MSAERDFVETIITFKVWSEAYATARIAATDGGPQPKLGEMIETIRRESERKAQSVRVAAAIDSSHELDINEMRRIVALDSAADLIERVLWSVRGWPDNVKDAIRNGPDPSRAKKRI